MAVTERQRTDEAYNLFVAKVVSIDYERMRVSLEDTRSKELIPGVYILPSSASSTETTEMVMPEIGSTCLACKLEMRGGHSETAVVSWVMSDTLSGIDAIATRPLPDTPGWSNRIRGVYRKTYPGDRTTVLTDGFTEKHDDGWDKAAADFSREKQDPLRRTRLETNGRKLSFTDSGLRMEGSVNRPGATLTDIKPRLLPDGSQEWVLYLNGTEVDGTTRYTKGIQDMIPLVERTEKIPEFSLDYTVPVEVLETDLLDTILGTTQDQWSRTTIKVDDSKVSYDSESFMVNQGWDHPTNAKATNVVGPTLKEGATPQRRAWMIEKTEGTLVGSNMFDPSTYAKVLKPVIFNAKFGSDVASHYSIVNKSTDQAETRLAASAFSLRFPYETNTTRLDITKEGMVAFEIGATLPKENVLWDSGTYEHPWGAGRSIDGNILGSVRLVVGKNREEEDSLDLTTMGGSVIRLGADDTSLPGSRRELKTQIRGQKDTVGNRTLQSWQKPKQIQDPFTKIYSNVVQGDAGDLTNKTGMENVSLRAATDGGLFLRLGARNVASKRRHLMNGYEDGQGVTSLPITSPNRQDSRSPGRPTYGASDSDYRFHDLTQVGIPKTSSTSPTAVQALYSWSGPPVTNMDVTGLSADIHAVRDILLRIGKNTQMDQSLLLDTAGGIVAAIGKDKLGHSLTAAFDGGIEATIGSDTNNKGVKLEIDGDVDISIRGNLHLNVTGDIIVDGVRILHTAKIAHLIKSPIIGNGASVMMLDSATVKVNDEGEYNPINPACD